jgi:tape measure domain-containing protein
MTLSLGTLEIGLGLNTADYDRKIARAENRISSLKRQVERVGMTARIKVEVDDRRLYELNDHLKLKRDDLDKTAAHYRRNPIRVRVEDDSLIRLNRELRELQRVSVDIRVPSRLVVEHRFSGYQDRVEKAIERLSVTVRNSSPRSRNPLEKLFNLTVGNAVGGFFTGAGAYAGVKAGKGFYKGFDTDFDAIGREFGIYTKDKVDRVKKGLDTGFRELLGFPDGLKDAKRLFQKNFDTFLDNITDPGFYRDLEDLFVAMAQAKFDPSILKAGAKLTESQAADKKIFEEARGKVVSRFEETVKEDFVRAAGAFMKLSAQPLRVRKRVQLRDSSEMARQQSGIFGREYDAVRDKIDASDNIVLMTGGVDPTKSKRGKPNVDTTYQIAAGIQALFPKAFVDTITPYHTTSIEDLEQGAYNRILRGSILPFIKEQKDALANLFGEKMVNDIIANLEQFHPVESILRQSVEKGYNDDSIRMATKALSASMMFPDKKITLAGASGGGFVVEEAIAILNQIAKRFPELRKAISNIKGFAIGTPMAGMTATSGGIKGEYAKFQAYIGTLDHIGKGFFGDTLYAGDRKTAKPNEIERLDNEIALPGGILNPKNNLQTVIGGWGYDHEVGKMLADLGKPVSEFLLLLSSFLNNRVMRPEEAKRLTGVFEKIKSLKVGQDANAYIDDLAAIIKEIGSVNKKIGGILDTKELGTLLRKTRQLARATGSEGAKQFEGQIAREIEGVLRSGLGIDNVAGLGERGGGQTSLVVRNISDLIRDAFNELARRQGKPSPYPESDFQPLDPFLESIATIEDALRKSAEELNLPAGDFGSLIQLWKAGKATEPPVRGYADEFRSVYRDFLKELGKLSKLGKNYFQKSEDGRTKVDFYKLLWDSAKIAAAYGQPPYAEMSGKYREQTFNTPEEKQMEKALLAFFKLYEKDAEIFKKQYLEIALEAKKLYAAGDPAGLQKLTELLSTSKFSRIAELGKNIKTAKSGRIGKEKALGEGTNYKRLAGFLDKLLESLVRYEVSNRQDTSGFGELAAAGYGINAILDFVNLAAERGKEFARVPDLLKSSQIQSALEDPEIAKKFEIKAENMKSALQEVYANLETPLERKTAEIVEAYVSGISKLIDSIDAEIVARKVSTPVTIDGRLREMAVNRLQTPDRNNEIVNIAGNEDTASLLLQTAKREIFNALNLSDKSLWKGANATIQIFDRLVIAARKVESAFLGRIPAAMAAKNIAAPVVAPMALGAMTLAGLPDDVAHGIYQSLYNVFHELYKTGSDKYVQELAAHIKDALDIAVPADANPAIRGIIQGVNMATEQIANAVIAPIQSVANSIVEGESAGTAYATATTVTGFAVETLFGTARKAIAPKALAPEKLVELEAKGMALGASLAKLTDSLSRITNNLPALPPGVDPFKREYYTRDRLREIARNQGLNVLPGGSKKTPSVDDYWKAIISKVPPETLIKLLLATNEKGRTKAGREALAGMSYAASPIDKGFVTTIGQSVATVRKMAKGSLAEAEPDPRKLAEYYRQLQKIKGEIAKVRANPELDTSGLNRNLNALVINIENLQGDIQRSIGNLTKGANNELDSARLNTREIGENAIDDLDDALGNRSPSWKGKRSGKNLIKGLEIGTAEEARVFIGQIDALFRDINKRLELNQKQGGKFLIYARREHLDSIMNTGYQALHPNSNKDRSLRKRFENAIRPDYSPEGVSPIYGFWHPDAAGKFIGTGGGINRPRALMAFGTHNYGGREPVALEGLFNPDRMMLHAGDSLGMASGLASSAPMSRDMVERITSRFGRLIEADIPKMFEKFRIATGDEEFSSDTYGMEGILWDKFLLTAVGALHTYDGQIGGVRPFEDGTRELAKKKGIELQDLEWVQDPNASDWDKLLGRDGMFQERTQPGAIKQQMSRFQELYKLWQDPSLPAGKRKDIFIELSVALLKQQGELRTIATAIGADMSTLMFTAGKVGASNFQKGLQIGVATNEAEKIAYQNALDIVDETNKGLGNASPSKKAMKAMRFFYEGLALGARQIRFGLGLETRFDKEVSDFTFFVGMKSKEARKAVLQALKEMGLDRGERLQVIDEVLGSMDSGTFTSPRAFQAMKRATVIARPKTTREEILGDWNKKRDNLFNTLDSIEKAGVSSGFTRGIVSGIRVAVAQLDGFIGSLSTAGKLLRTIDKELDAATGGMFNLRKAALAVVGGFALLKGAEFLLQPLYFGIQNLPFTVQQAVTNSLQSLVELQRIKVNLDVAGVDNADEAIGQLRDRANELGISFKESVKQYAQFRIVTTDTPLEAQGDSIYRGFQSALAVRNTNPQQQTETFRAINQMASRSVLSVEEFTQQLTESGGLYDALIVAARAMGLTTAEFYRQASAGQLLSQDVIPRLSAEYERMSAGGLGESGKTLQAEINRYQNNLEQLSMGVGEKIGAVAYPALQLLNVALGGVNDNLDALLIVARAALNVTIGLVTKSVLQFIAATRLGQLVLSSYNAALFTTGVRAGETATRMQMLSATAKATGVVFNSAISVMAIPLAVTAGLQLFFAIWNAGSEDLRNNLQTIKESKKVLEDLGKIKPESNRQNFLEKVFTPEQTKKDLSEGNWWDKTVALFTWSPFREAGKVGFDSYGTSKDIRNINDTLKEGETVLKGYRDQLSDVTGIDKFIDSLQGLRNKLAQVRAERAIAAGKGDSAGVARANTVEQELMKQEQEAIDKRFGSLGSRIAADLQAYESSLAKLEESYQKGNVSVDEYTDKSTKLKAVIAQLKAEQQNYLNILKDQEKQYKKLQFGFKRTLNAQENRDFINARKSLNRQIGNEKGFAAGQLNEYEFNVRVREESLQTAKEKIASLQTTATETGAKLNTRITEAADKTLSTYFGKDLERLGVGSFSEAIAKNLLSPKMIEDVMDEFSGDLESNAALKNILEMAKRYVSTRQDILSSEKEIQAINREIITERKRRQINEKQAGNEVLIAGKQEKLYSSTPTGKLRSFQSSETRLSLEELYKQLAIEQERLAANVDDPLPIKSNIARIKANIARTRLSLRDQQNDLAEFYATTAIEIEATNKLIGLTSRTVSSQVKTFARDQTLIELGKLYKQLAFEQSKLNGTLKGDPLEIKANIARIQLQIEQAKLSLRDQSFDLVDYYTNLQKQIVDLRVSIEDFQIQSSREVRGFREAYGDMIRGLQRSLIESENEFRASQRSLEGQRLRVSMLGSRTPGVNSLQKQIDELILQYRDEIASIQGEADGLRTKPLDIQDQSIQFARQLRDLQEQIYDAERNRLKQLRDFWTQQVQIAKEIERQQLTFKSLNEIWAGILENSKKLLARSGEIAGGKSPKIAPAIGGAGNAGAMKSEATRQGTPNNPRTLQRGDYIDYGNGQIYKYDPSPTYDPKTRTYRETVNADNIQHPSVVQQVQTSGSAEFDRLLMRSGLYKNWEGFARTVLNPNLQPLTPEERANYNAGNVPKYSGALSGQPMANIPLAPLPSFDYDRARELDTQIRINRERTLENQKAENLLKLERARRENLDRIAGLILQTRESRIQAEIGLRDTGDSSSDLMLSSKGYLTFSERVEQTRRNGNREIEKQREGIQSQIRSLGQLTDSFAKNSEETRARLLKDTGNDDAFNALAAENKRNLAILEGYKALDDQLAKYGQIRGDAAATRAIEEERVTALERYNNLIADGIDASNRMNPLGNLFNTGESRKLRIEADFARRRLELKRYAEEGSLSPQKLGEMSAALDKMQQADLASAFIEANPAVGAFGDLLRAAFTGGRDTLQQMLNVLINFLQKIGEMAANQLLMQIFGGGGKASPVPTGGGSGFGSGILGALVSGIIGGATGGSSSFASLAPTSFTGASSYSLGTGLSLFSSGGKIGGDAPVEKNMVSAFRRERSMSGGRNPRLIVANEDEYVIPANEARSYLEYKNAPVKNYAGGGFVGGTGYNVTTSNNSSSDRSLAITNVSNITIESRNDMGYSLTQLKERENAQNERTKRRFFG